MGGSLLSKFRWRHNMMISPSSTGPSDSKAKLSWQSLSCTVKYAVIEEQAMVAEKPSVATTLPTVVIMESGPLDDASVDYIFVNQVLKSSPAVLKVKVLEDFEEIIKRQVKKEAIVLESARDMLTAQSNLKRSTSRMDVTSRSPVHTHTVSLGDTPGSTAFEILWGERRTVCAAARMPRRLRKLIKAPQLTAEHIAEKMKSVEEKRMKALARTRAAAKVNEIRHPSEELARITAQKISDKMRKADSKRNKAIERKRKAGRKTSRSLRKIAEAQAYAQVQIKSNFEQKRKKFEMSQDESADRMAYKKRRREAHAQRVKEKAKYELTLLDVPVVLQLEADEHYYASDSDGSWSPMERL